MLIPDISVTCSSTTMNSSGLTLTITGISSNKDYHTTYRGATWSCISALSTNAASLTAQVVHTTASVPSSGFSSATNYQLDVFALVLKEAIIQNNRITKVISP